MGKSEEDLLVFAQPAARQKLTFKRTSETPSDLEPHRCPGTESFLAAVQDTSSSPSDVVRLLLNCRDRLEAQAKRGELPAGFRASSMLCSCWAAALTTRENLCKDAAEVAVEQLRTLLCEPSGYRSGGIFLDGLATVNLDVSKETSDNALQVLQAELDKKLPNVPCVDLWMDIVRQFRIQSVQASSWMQGRSKLIAAKRWGEAAVMSMAVGQKVHSVLDSAFSNVDSYREDLLGLAVRLSPRTHKDCVHRLLDADLPHLADRFRRACTTWHATLTPHEDLRMRLQDDLLQHLRNLGLEGRASQLAKQQVINASEIEHLQKGQGSETKVEQSGGSLPSQHCYFSIEENMVKVVDDKQSALEFSRAFEQTPGSSSIIGLDCEWPPHEQGISICQIASRTCVWILDLTWVCNTQNQNVSRRLQKLLSDPSLLKLGFAFQEDLDRLHKALHKFGGLPAGIENFIDLHIDGRGLAAIFRDATGHSLDKSLQCSPWGARPLSTAQLCYAAADAYCLLTLYDALGIAQQPALLKPRSSVQLVSQLENCTNLTSKDVSIALNNKGVVGRFEQIDNDADHYRDVGNVLCFVLKPHRHPVAVITRAGYKVDASVLGKTLNVGKNRVRMASSEECVRLFGFKAGAIPPVALYSGVEVWLSNNLKAHDTGFPLRFSSGSVGSHLLLDVASLVQYYGENCWLHDEEETVKLADVLSKLAHRQEVPIFACDSMLHCLARKLRGLDLDVAVVGYAREHESYPSNARRSLPPADKALRPTASRRRREEEHLYEFVRQGRIGLTSSPSTFAALQDLVYLLRGTTADEQVREICMVFGINTSERVAIAMDRRCCLCNGRIVTVGREQMEGKVPNRALEAYEHFFVCSNDPCETIFWHGSSYREGRHEIQRIVADMCFDTESSSVTSEQM